MRNYSHIISKLFNEPTLLTPARHAALCHLLEARLSARSPEDSPEASANEPQMARPTVWRADANGNRVEDVRIAGSVAHIPVHGTLVAHPEDIAMSECGCAMEDLARAIDLAENNPAVKTVLYNFRTPGGSVTMIPETGRKIRDSRKQTVGFFDSQCCSGGAWLAAQCRQLYGTQSGRFGSIGVYTMCLDMSEALAKEGIKVNAISAGKFKLMGASWKPLEDEERAILQAGVNKIRAQFYEAMETWRIVSDEHFGNGLVFDGEEAAQLGFTDGVVDSLDDVLSMVGE